MAVPVSSSSRLRNLLLALLVAVVYFALARVSLQLAFQSSNATPVWAPSGLALAALLLLGRRIAPGILLGAMGANLLEFLSNHTASVPTALWASALIGVGNMAEALAGYYLLQKLMPGVQASAYFHKVTHVFLFVLVAILACLVSCSVGSLAVWLADIVPTSQLFTVCLTWWTGDVASMLLVTPLLLAWARRWRLPAGSIHLNRLAEAMMLVTCMTLTSGIVFRDWFSPSFLLTRAVWLTPFLIWAAVRFEQRVVTAMAILSAVLAVHGTTSGLGPFVSGSLNESLLTVQAFISVNTVMALLLNAALCEKKRTEVFLQAARQNLETLVQERTAALTASNLQLEEAQRLAHIGSWEWEIASNRISWSDELYCIYGLSRGILEPSYEELLRYIHPDDLDQVHHTIQNAYQNLQPFDFYYRIVRPNGGVRTVYSRGEVICDKEGQVVKMTGTAQDVTEAQVAQNLLEKTSCELEQKNKELQRSNSELASFSHIAGHDLQEPLRKIKMFTDRILAEDEANLSGVSKDSFRRIQSAVTRMKLLIENLLSYSRVDTATKHFELTDLNQLLQEVKADLSETIQQKGAIIESCPLPRLRVIPFQFRQLFTNIIGNALKFSRPDTPPHILIEADVVSDEVSTDPQTGLPAQYHHLSISDNGIGFDPAYREKVFEIFQRLNGQSEYPGTGIGLAICKKIIDNHRGHITANGQPGKGATFHIYLPVSAEEEMIPEPGTATGNESFNQSEVQE